MIQLLILTFFSLSIKAQLPDCEPTASELGKNIELVSCATEAIEEELVANPGSTKQACACANKHNKSSKVLGLPSESNSDFIRTKLLGELKKTLTENINYIAKLRVLPIKNNYQQSIQACNLDSLTQTCSNDPGLVEFRKSITSEVALLISPLRSSSDEGTVDRKMSENSCEISDSAILQAQSLMIDEELTEDFVSKIKTADLSNTDNILKFLNTYKAGIPLDNLLMAHPVLGPLLNKPVEFKNFFMSLKSPVLADFKKKLYESSNLAGTIDNQIASSCEKAIKSYEAVACGNNINLNKIKLSSLNGLEPLINSQGFKIDDETIDLVNPNPKTLKTTEDIVKLCSVISNDKNATDIRPFFNDLKSLIDPKYQKLSYEEYRTSKYQKDFNIPRNNICSQLNPMCTADDYSCRLAKLIKDPKNQALASSTDPGMQKLLRSFVGDKPSLSTSPATRDILIAQGIWPKSDGSYVAQKNVPERKSNYFTELASTNVESTVPVQANLAAQGTPERRQTATSQTNQKTLPSNYSGQNAASFSETSSTASATAREIDQADLDELRRKVEDLKNSPNPSKEQKPSSTPTTSQTRLAQNIPTRSAIAGSFAQAIPDQATAPATGAASTLPSQSNDTRDTRDPGQLAAQASQARMNQALAGMAGARGASGAQNGQVQAKLQEVKDRSPASESESQGALITKVLDSSQLQNLNTLAQQRRDFVFQINTSTFKITFDQQTGTYNAQLTSPRTEDSDVLKQNLLQYLNRSTSKGGRLNSLQQAFKS